MWLSSLKNMDGLKNWDISNGELFVSMFSDCSSLQNVDSLKNWNVSNRKNFGALFSCCTSLQNVDGLKIGMFLIQQSF